MSPSSSPSTIPASTARRSPLEPGGDRTRNMRTEPVGDAADPAAPADDPPVAAVQNDMNTAAGQPAAFVEAVLRTARSADRDAQGENRALRRRTAGGKLEQDSLPQRCANRTDAPRLECGSRTVSFAPGR